MGPLLASARRRASLEALAMTEAAYVEAKRRREL